MYNNNRSYVHKYCSYYTERITTYICILYTSVGISCIIINVLVYSYVYAFLLCIV